MTDTQEVTLQYADFDDLVSSDELKTEDLILPNGMTIKVRGFSRYEYMLALKNATEDPGLIERRIVKFGMINPKLDDNQVERWFKSAPAGIISVVSDAIRRLSRMGEDADKSDVS